MLRFPNIILDHCSNGGQFFLQQIWPVIFGTTSMQVCVAVYFCYKLPQARHDKPVNFPPRLWIENAYCIQVTISDTTTGGFVLTQKGCLLVEYRPS